MQDLNDLGIWSLNVKKKIIYLKISGKNFIQLNLRVIFIYLFFTILTYYPQIQLNIFFTTNYKINIFFQI